MVADFHMENLVMKNKIDLLDSATWCISIDGLTLAKLVVFHNNPFYCQVIATLSHLPICALEVFQKFINLFEEL